MYRGIRRSFGSTGLLLALLAVCGSLTTPRVAAGPQGAPVVIGPVERPEQFPGPRAHPCLVQTNALIRAPLARSTYGISGSGLTVAVLDTGLRTTHVDFAGRVLTQRNFTPDNGGNVNDATDGNGHGTNVSGIICANGDHTGIAPGANIIPLKILDNSGSGYTSWEASALDWVIANRLAYNITCVNISAGTYSNYTSYSPGIDSAGLRSRIQTLRAAKVPVCISSGNDFYSWGSAQGMSYPAIISECMSVGAVYDANIGPVSYWSGAEAYSTFADAICPFSQRLHESVTSTYRTDIFAPGAELTSSGIDGDHGESVMHGTSQACPVTAGAILLIQHRYLQRNGTLPTVDEVETLLRNNAVTVNDGDNENDNVTNTGLNFRRVDAYASCAAVGGGGPAYRPDALVKNSSSGTWLGDGTYNTDGTSQTAAQNVIPPATATYHLRVQNDGSSADTIKVTGTRSSTGWTITYYSALSGGTNITTSVTGTGWSVPLAAGASRDFRVVVRAASTVPTWSSKTVSVTATSVGSSSIKDVVKAVTTKLVANLDSYEPDNSVAQAKDIPANGTKQYHSIQPRGDNDWLRFPAVAGSTYAIATTQHSGKVAMNTYLELYDTSGTTRLAYDNDSGPGQFSLIIWTCSTTGSYYVKARGYTSYVTGYYDIAVTGTGPASANPPADGAAPALAVVRAVAAPTGVGGAEVRVWLSAEAAISAEVLNIAGRPIRRLCSDRVTSAGASSLVWDGRSATGTRVPAGRYLVRVTARCEDGAQCQSVAPLLLAR